MKAIVTRYIGPTDTRGSRIKASAEGVPSISVPYPHELSGDDVYCHAASMMAAKYGWSGELVHARLPNGDTVFMFRSHPSTSLDNE